LTLTDSTDTGDNFHACVVISSHKEEHMGSGSLILGHRFTIQIKMQDKSYFQNILLSFLTNCIHKLK